MTLRLLSLPALTLALAFCCAPALRAEPPAKPSTPSTSASAAETIEATDAQKLKDSVGKEVKVTGKVIGVGQDSRSGNVFLNFSRDRDTGFVVMVQGSVAKGAGVDLKEKYNGKEVVVTGLVKLFKNKTEIVVTSLDQIAVK